MAVKIVDKIHVPALVREIETWRHLRHPNIAQLYEVLMSETKIYMVTEYAGGGEIFDYVTRGGAVACVNADSSPGRAKLMFKQLLDAMKYCHDKQYVHRDLKLENIMLDIEGNIKLIDFGFTRHVESDKNKLMETYCGSVAYAAPEMILGQKYSGVHADCWSLGIILYTLVCGYLPFDDDNESRVHAKIMNLDYELPDTLDADTRDLITRILKLNPNDRIDVESMLKHPWFSYLHQPAASAIPKLMLETSVAQLSIASIDVND